MNDSAIEMPLSEISAALRSIVSQVTGLSAEEISDDRLFLDYITSSLELIDVFRLVHERFGVRISIRRAIEEHPNLSALSRAVAELMKTQRREDEARAARLRERLNASASATAGMEIPLSRAQQHIGFLARYSGGAAAAWNEALVLRLQGPLQLPALKTAIDSAQRLHEATRACLRADADSLLLQAASSCELEPRSVEHARLSAELSACVSRAFELGEPLFRVELLRLSETDHVLVFVGHGLVVEYEALELIAQDIAHLYVAALQGTSAELHEGALQLSDYTRLCEAETTERTRAAAAEYWRGAFAHGVPRLDLPSDRPRPPVKSYAGARLVVPLPAELQSALQAHARAEGQSEFVVMLATFSVLLHRLAAESDVVVGVGSGPMYLETGGSQVVARSRNMVPLRSHYEPQRSFREHVRELATALSGAYYYGDYSFSELLQTLNLPRDQSRSALFSVGFRAQPMTASFKLEGLQTSALVAPAPGARYDLELVWITGTSGTMLACDYSSELFDRQAVSRQMRSLLELLAAGLREPERAVGRLTIVPAPEREQLLTTWNATKKPYTRDQTVLASVQAHAASAPEALAVRCSVGELSYANLLERSQSIAARLHAAGVRAGGRVAFLLPRTSDLVAAILGTWQIGAVYLPLEPRAPLARKALMLSDASPSALLTARGLGAEALELGALPVLWLDADPTAAACAPAPSHRASGSDSAYIMYTSGSTGRPKGVEITHAALINVLQATRELMQFDASCLWLAVTTVGFDISLAELLVPLIAGGAVYLAEDDASGDGLRLVELLRQRAPTHLQLTPSGFKQLLAAQWTGDSNLTLVTVGESLSRAVAEPLCARSRVLWNLYGPTEATIYATAHCVESTPDRPVSIGRPLPNVRAYVLDAQQELVGIGTVGELYLAGDGLARGYWAKPELTAERFLTNPFEAGSLMYRTGDLARWEATGELMCLGRADRQVKVHGVRVELEEVEGRLRQVPQVRNAAVGCFEDANGDNQLVAYVVPEVGLTLDAAGLRSALRASLPDAMLPAHFVFSQTLPLSINGKIDRRALPPPSAAIKVENSSVQVLETPTEQLLAEIWSKLLHVETIGRESDYFELGGNSLAITPLLVQIRQVFHVGIGMREFFQAPRLHQLATLIDTQRRDRTRNQATTPLRQASDWVRQRSEFLRREAELPADLISSGSMQPMHQGSPEYVLLTGATGFLGGYLITEILQKTKARLVCLVRKHPERSGKQRIEAGLRHYDLWSDDPAWQDAWRQRVQVVDGDVSLPKLGLPQRTYEALASEIDAIIHSAALVNFLYPYEMLRPTNVAGVQQIIAFGLHRRYKPVHYLSTAAIWPMGNGRMFLETDSIEHNQLLNLGYDEAKWVGERALLHAAERGLPVARYRPGEVGGDSVTGRCVLEHLAIAGVKGLIQLGAFPVLDAVVDITPADYVAQATVHLMFQRNPIGRAFHLTNPRSCHLSDSLTFLRSLGYSFEELPFNALRERLIYGSDFANNALFPFFALIEDFDESALQLPHYDCRGTLRELAGSGIVCPPVDHRLFTTYIRHLQSVGFLPDPHADGASPQRAVTL